jgi:hypothetical protein
MSTTRGSGGRNCGDLDSHLDEEKDEAETCALAVRFLSPPTDVVLEPGSDEFVRWQRR